MNEKVKVLIIGSGPAGYTAAIYAARAALSPVLYTGMQPGGQLTTTNEVENFPGYPQGIKGPEMMIDLQKQAERFGTRVFFEMVTAADLKSYPFKVSIGDGKTMEALSVIIATGATAKYLGLESEKTYANRGVSACATCDGYFFREQRVAVVGGGDSAAEEAAYLSHLCKEVHLIVRRGEMRASVIMQKRVKNTSNIFIHWNTETEEIEGNGERVTGLRVFDNITGEKKVIPVEGVFLAIGHQPNTSLFEGQLDMDEGGYIKVRPGSAITGIPGVFAVGDVADRVYRQAVTAAGTGCMGALDAEKFLASQSHD